MSATTQGILLPAVPDAWSNHMNMLPTTDRYVWYSRDRLRNSRFVASILSGAFFCCFEHRSSRSAGSPPLLRRACFLAGFAVGTTKSGEYVADWQRRQL